MRFNLIPKDESFYELFDAQASYNVAAAQAFHELTQNWDSKSPAFERLREIEHEADITTHEIFDKLDRTFVTPLDREDIHGLAGDLDDVVDLIQSISTRMKLYRLERSSEDLVAMADILRQATENIRKAISELRQSHKSRRVLDYCIEINRLENAGDRAFEQAVGRLFAGKPDALEAVKWNAIYEAAEQAVDKCEDVANTISSILVKHG